MGRRAGCLTQHHLHVVDIWLHGSRHPEWPGIGIGSGIGPHPQHLIRKGHHRLFKKQRDDLQQPIPGELHISGEDCPHLLAIQMEIHIAVDIADDLLQGVFPQRGVNTGPRR